MGNETITIRPNIEPNTSSSNIIRVAPNPLTGRLERNNALAITGNILPSTPSKDRGVTIKISNELKNLTTETLKGNLPYNPNSRLTENIGLMIGIVRRARRPSRCLNQGEHTKASCRGRVHLKGPDVGQIEPINITSLLKAVRMVAEDRRSKKEKSNTNKSKKSAV